MKGSKIAIHVLIYFLYSLNTSAQYNYYYGNIHAHTRYSDGNKDSATTGVGTPGASYFYAKSTYHFDFLGIAEHNHYTSAYNPGMLLPKYALGLAQADTATQTGTFVAMYGMEWGTISTGGHVVTYGYPGLIGWETISGSANYNTYCPKGDFASYWNIVKTVPASFTTLAHTEVGDYDSMLTTLPYNSGADSAITGVAVRSGSATSTTTNYSDGPATSYETRFKQALAKGYHVGPTIDHDTHYTNFGRANPSRTVVLAATLSKDSIMDAFRKNRFYASDDWNTQVSFTCNGSVMGQVLESSTNPTLVVTVSDADAGDNVSSLQLYYGKPGSGVNATVLTSTINNNTLSYTHSMSVDSQYYYYARITQADGDVIWTSPIWYKKTAISLPITAVELYLTATQRNVTATWTLETPTSGFSSTLEHSVDGQYFSPLTTFSDANLTYSYLHTQLSAGKHYYRIKITNVDGHETYSEVKSAIISTQPMAFTLSPNPAHDYIVLAFESYDRYPARMILYNSDGQEVLEENVIVQNFINSFKISVDQLPTGLYYLVLQNQNGRLIDSKFLKQ